MPERGRPAREVGEKRKNRHMDQYFLQSLAPIVPPGGGLPLGKMPRLRRADGKGGAFRFLLYYYTGV